MEGTKASAGAAKAIAVVSGILCGIAGMEHGFFEMLQGNTAPADFRIDAIGPAVKFWEHGSEPAYTLIPNFLITGIAAMCVGLMLAIWSIFFLEKKPGLIVFLLLGIVLFMVGGGVAPFFIVVMNLFVIWRIGKPFPAKKGLVSENARHISPVFWIGSLIVFSISYFFALELAVFGWFFGMENPVIILYGFAVAIPVFFVLTAATGLIYDSRKAAISSLIK